MNFNPTKAMVREILTNPFNASRTERWSLQGFGMLRLNLQDDVRLHVWDGSFTVPNVSLIHDHPWDFESYVVVGELKDQHYRDITDGMCDTEFPALKRTIKPGFGLKTLVLDEPAKIYRYGDRNYKEGDSYSLRASDIHSSHPLSGKVTLVKRTRVGEDIAHVYCDPNVGFVSAEPREATSFEIREICNYSLKRWFE